MTQTQKHRLTQNIGWLAGVNVNLDFFVREAPEDREKLELAASLVSRAIETLNLIEVTERQAA